jgi:GNAT superfamily N-acetyltransferase
MRVELRLDEHDSAFPAPQAMTAFAALHTSVFPETPAAAVRDRLLARPRFLFQLAWLGPDLAGYKVGFEEAPERFHSWLGAVAPALRRQGVASALMRAQHAWCRAHGYRNVTTNTTNRWPDMLVLDIRHGFAVIGTYTDAHGDTKILLAKALEPAGSRGEGAPT